MKNLPAHEGDLALIPEWEDPLEKGMAAHSSTLACTIPWIEEPGGLQSTGPQRVRYSEQLALSLSDLPKHVHSPRLV